MKKQNELTEALIAAEKDKKRRQSIKNVILFALGVIGYLAYQSLLEG